mmetsp:Transcript_23841/g.49970  ORF Transcript_23841/g.49970 Transcript_23841/m.49970 type:complete len:260 (-) Transcript_23841:274-1053(-)
MLVRAALARALVRMVVRLHLVHQAPVLAVLVHGGDAVLGRRGQHVLQRDAPSLAHVDRGRRVQRAHRLLGELQMLLVDEIGFVHKQHVAALNLLTHQVDDLPVVLVGKIVGAEVGALVHLVALLELVEEGGDVDDGDERVKLGACEQLGLRDECVSEIVADLARLGDAARLDDDVVPRHAALGAECHQLLDRLQKLLGHRAAGAAVLQLHRVLSRVGPQRRVALGARLGAHQRSVDVHFRHVIHDESHLESSLVGENVL